MEMGWLILATFIYLQASSGQVGAMEGMKQSMIWMKMARLGLGIF